jgi:hypothetical protein
MGRQTRSPASPVQFPPPAQRRTGPASRWTKPLRSCPSPSRPSAEAAARSRRESGDAQVDRNSGRMRGILHQRTSTRVQTQLRPAVAEARQHLDRFLRADRGMQPRPEVDPMRGDRTGLAMAPVAQKPGDPAHGLMRDARAVPIDHMQPPARVRVHRRQAPRPLTHARRRRTVDRKVLPTFWTLPTRGQSRPRRQAQAAKSEKKRTPWKNRRCARNRMPRTTSCPFLLRAGRLPYVRGVPPSRSMSPCRLAFLQCPRMRRVPT